MSITKIILREEDGASLDYYPDYLDLREHRR